MSRRLRASWFFGSVVNHSMWRPVATHWSAWETGLFTPGLKVWALRAAQELTIGGNHASLGTRALALRYAIKQERPGSDRHPYPAFPESASDVCLVQVGHR